MDGRPELTPPQIAELHGWERFLRRFYMGSITALLAAMLVVLYVSENAIARRSILVLALGLVVAATVIQRRVRCPNCHSRLGFPSKMRFPDFCPACRAHFPRPEGW